MSGERTYSARVRLPIVAPTVTMLTETGAANRPYGEMIDLGQRLLAASGGRVLNVSVMGGSRSPMWGLRG